MSFNWRIYKHFNPDLKFSTQIEYERHYTEYGKRERRPFSIYSLYPDFDYKQYQSNYVDLKYYSKPDLEFHWISVGRKQGRVYKKVAKWVYIIDGVKLGGTKKYIEDLSKYYGISVRLITNKLDITKYNINAFDTILVQQLAFTAITPNDLLEVKMVRKPKIFIVLHDFSWLNKNIYNTSNNIQHTIYTNPQNEVIQPVHMLFNTVDGIICPSKFIYDEYSKRINNKRLQIVPHTDYKCNMNRILVPKVTNTINIGVFHSISEVKGSEYVAHLMSKYKDFNGTRINYYVVGVTIGNYNEDEYFKLLSKYNIHGLLLLNKYGESWCYLLTKYLFSGLPILYNNIGSFKERITPLENRFSVGDLDGRIDVSRLNTGYQDMLKYIVDNGKQGKRVWVDGASLEKPEFYVNLFNRCC